MVLGTERFGRFGRLGRFGRFIRLGTKSWCSRLGRAGLLFLGCLAAFGCSGPPVASNIALTPNPNPKAPLVASLTFDTDKPATVSLRIDDGEQPFTVEPERAPTTSHDVLVLGLLPGVRHTITATVTDERGQATVLDPLEIETDPLPDDVPPFTVPIRRPGQMEPGLTLVPIFRWTEVPGEDDDTWGVVLALDAEGRVRWLFRNDAPVGEPRRLRNGNLFFNAGRTGRLFEVDMKGNVVQAWHSRLVKDEDVPEGSIEVATDTFHHDVIELPNSNFMALSTEARHFDDYPTSYAPNSPRAPSHVIGDLLVEFTRDGEVVRELPILDRLDPYRLGPGSLSTGFYEEEYEEVLEEPGKDWAHSNALVYDGTSNTVLLSSNMQSVHYKIDWESGDLLWLLGDPAGWKSPWSEKLLQPKGEVAWAYHHHGVEYTGRDSIILYDNGGERSIPPNPEQPMEERFSRAVEYRVDEANGTVEQVWQYGPEREWFMSPFISDADWLPETGNVLITDGGRFALPGGEQNRTFGGRSWARVLEVTSDEEPEKLWELIVDDPARGYSIYRAQRIKSLYPSIDIPTG